MNAEIRCPKTDAALLARRLVVFALLLPLFAGGCTQLRQFRRFYLSPCPGQGPSRESEFQLQLRPVSLEAYYAELLTSAGTLPRRKLARVPASAEEFPIYHFGPLGQSGGKRLLIIAGVHGNELAGLLAAPRILEDLAKGATQYAGVELHLIAPANPVGLKHLSRYNQQGCDINRDFGPFRTPEAEAVRNVLNSNPPDLILALHEGPQDGFFVIATQGTPLAFAEAAIAGAVSAGFALGTRSFLGLRLERPGMMREGWLITAGKRLLRIRTLGAYARSQGIPVVTTESPWAGPDLDRRVDAQLAAIRSVAAFLSQQTAR